MKVIGHRGAAFYEPENTLRSIKKAIEFGVDFVEIDVHLSKDKKIVVIHDDKVDRTTNGRGYVLEFNLADLKKLDAGKGEKIPTLQEVIYLAKDKVNLIIELKCPGITKPVTDIINKNDIEKNVYVISFWHDMVKEIKAINKNIKTGVLFVGNPIDANKLALNANADMLDLNFKFLTKKLVTEAHNAGLEVFTWNVDDKGYIKQVTDTGVDAIGSNKPDLLVNYFKLR